MPKFSSSLDDLNYKPKASSSSIPKRARKRVKPDHPINNHSGSPGKSAGRSPDATYDEKKDIVYLHFAGIPRSSYYACLLNTRFIPSCAGMDPKELVRNGGRDDVETALRNAEIFGMPPARRATERVAEGMSLNWFPWPPARPREGYSELGHRPGSSGEGDGDIWAGPPIPFLDDDATVVDFWSSPHLEAANNADRVPSPTPTRSKKPSISHKKKVISQPTQRKRAIIPGSPIPPEKSVGSPKRSSDQPQVNASRVKRDAAAFNLASKVIRSKVTNDRSRRDASEAEDDTPMFVQGSSSMPSSTPFRKPTHQVDTLQEDNDTPFFIPGSTSTSPFGDLERPSSDKAFASTASPPRFETPTAEMDESALYDYLYGFGAPIVKLPPARFKDDTSESAPTVVNEEPIVLETRSSPVHLDYSDYLHQDELPPSQSASDAVEGATAAVNEEEAGCDTLPSPSSNDYLQPSQYNDDVPLSATAVVNDEEALHKSSPSPIHNDYSDYLHSDALPPSHSRSDGLNAHMKDDDVPAATLPSVLISPARNNYSEYLHPDDDLPHPPLGSPVTHDTFRQNESQLMDELFGGPYPLSDEEIHRSLVNTPPPAYHGTIDPVLLGGGEANDDAPILEQIHSAPSQLSLSCSSSRPPTPPPRNSTSDPIDAPQSQEADTEMEDAASLRKGNSESHLLPTTESSIPAKTPSSSRTHDVPPSRRSAPRTSTAPPKVVVWSVRPKDAKGQELPFPQRVGRQFDFPAAPIQRFCHQCRNRPGRLMMNCTCGKDFCMRCVMMRYDDRIFPFDASAKNRPCPMCMDICNCTQCCLRRKEVYVSSVGACVKIVGEPDNLVLPPPKLKSRHKPSLKRRASRSVSPPPDRPHRVHKRPTKYRSPLPVPDFPAPVYQPMPLPAGPLAYWATIYGMSGQKLATAFTGGDAAEVVIVKPIQPPTTMVADQPAPHSTVPRRFVGKVQPSWGYGPDPYVTDVESDSLQGTRVRRKGKERQRKPPYARRFIGDPSLLYAKFKEDTSETPLCPRIPAMIYWA
ncbi:hypothetical protein PTI98_012467 [Pleurotus ostreatus]|nr:hypothetical protein PTI98_012467 [Pleurotus ostreatus]